MVKKGSKIRPSVASSIPLPGDGSGLGLAVAHGIMKSHLGAIRAESQLGKGTTFLMYFAAYNVAPLRRLRRHLRRCRRARANTLSKSTTQHPWCAWSQFCWNSWAIGSMPLRTQLRPWPLSEPNPVSSEELLKQARACGVSEQCIQQSSELHASSATWVDPFSTRFWRNTLGDARKSLAWQTQFWYFAILFQEGSTLLTGESRGHCCAGWRDGLRLLDGSMTDSQAKSELSQ